MQPACCVLRHSPHPAVIAGCPAFMTGAQSAMLLFITVLTFRNCVTRRLYCTEPELIMAPLPRHAYQQLLGMLPVTPVACIHVQGILNTIPG
jgi:hypothetical protein